MKKAFGIIAALLLCSFTVMANNGNNNNNNTNNDNSTDNKAIELVKQDGAVDPYASSLETPIPGCHGPKDHNRVCTREYAPVCGCDGQTYGNACSAIKEGILIFTPGECGSTQVLTCFDPGQANPGAACPAVYAPVCACGVLTFPNACEALRLGFINTTPGPCLSAGQ